VILGSTHFTSARVLALGNRQEAVSDDAWGGRWCSVFRDYNDDGWREYDDAVPVIAPTLELLAEHRPLEPLWWRYGRKGRHSLTEALDKPNNRAFYDQRQAAQEKEAWRAHRELMETLACIDCGKGPKEESAYEYEIGRSKARPGAPHSSLPARHRLAPLHRNPTTPSGTVSAVVGPSGQLQR
jgi:hypothetical protein